MAGYQTRDESSDDGTTVAGYAGRMASSSGGESHLHADASAIRRSSAGTRSTVEFDEQEPTNAHGGRLGASKDQSARFNLREQMRNAVVAAGRLVSAAKANEPIEMGIAGTELIDALSVAAKFKSVRERTWYQALTVVHGAVAICELDGIGVCATEAIEKCVDLLSNAGLDKSDLITIRKMLRDNDLDPWGPISLKMAPDEDETDGPTSPKEASEGNG
jgi:hypothetical protein